MEKEVVVTYFSPFTDLPVMVETETHKYLIEVTKVIKKEEKLKNLNKPYSDDDYIVAASLGFDLDNYEDYVTYFELDLEEES